MRAGTNDEIMPAPWLHDFVVCSEPTYLCLLFIHPGAPNLISLRSAGTMAA